MRTVILALGSVVAAGACAPPSGDGEDPADWRREPYEDRPLTSGEAYPQAGEPGWGFMPHIRFAVFMERGSGRSPQQGYDLMLSCDGDSLSVHYYAPPGTIMTERRRLILTSGTEREIVEGHYNAGEITPPPSAGFAVAPSAHPGVDASMSVVSPVFQRFLDTGRLSVTNGGRTLVADASARERAYLRRFFRPCLN